MFKANKLEKVEAGSAIHSSHLGFPVAETFFVVSFFFFAKKKEAKEKKSIAQKHNKATQQITCKHLKKK